MTNMSLLLDNPFTFHGDDSIDQCNVGDSAWWILFFPPSPLSVDADATTTIHLLSRDQVIRWLQNRYEKSAKQFIHDPPIPLGQWQQINARSIMFRSRQAGYYMCTNSSTGNDYTHVFTISRASSCLVSKLATSSVLHSQGTTRTKVQTSWWSLTTLVRGVSFINLTGPDGNLARNSYPCLSNSVIWLFWP